MNYEEELEKYDEEFADLPVTEPMTFEDIPPGRYQVEVDEARVEKAQTSGRLQFTVFYRIISGDLEDNNIPKFTGLDTPIGREIAKNDLHRMGMDLEKLSDLPKLTPMLIGQKLEVMVKLNEKDGQTYRNVFINKRIEEAPSCPEGSF